MNRIDVALAIIVRDERLLICRRRQADQLGGFWEFPGGKATLGEGIQQCLNRELQEELGIDVEPVAALSSIDHDYPDILVRLHPFLCVHKIGEIKPLACQELRWVKASSLPDYSFPPANADLINQLVRLLG